MTSRLIGGREQYNLHGYQRYVNVAQAEINPNILPQIFFYQFLCQAYMRLRSCVQIHKNVFEHQCFRRRFRWDCVRISRLTYVRLQNLPWSKTGLVSRQVLHPLSKLQNWIWSKTGRYKTGLVSNTKIEASLRATKPKPWQSNLTSDTVEIFIQNEKAGLVPMQSRFRSRHKAGFGAVGLS